MKLFFLVLTFFLVGCVSPIKNAKDLADSVEMIVEPSDCVNCKKKIIARTRSFHVGEFIPKDNKGVLQFGEAITPQIELGLTNTGFSVSPRDIKLPATIYKNNIYLRDINSSKADNWSFFLHVYQGGRSGSNINVLNKYRTYLLVEGVYVPIPIYYTPIRKIYTMCSVQWGCSWDEEYVIPATLIEMSIKKKQPIKLLFRYEDVRKNLLPPKINSESVSDKDGLFVEISSEYISSFLDRAILEISK